MTKRALLAFAIVVFGLASLSSRCGGENADVSIVGKWKLVESSGGITGGGRNPLPDMTVEFTEDGKMTWYGHDEVTGSVRYSIGVDKTVFDPDPAPVIYVNDEVFHAYSFPDKDTLVLVDNASDSYIEKYQRV